MKWARKILSCSFTKKNEDKEATKPRVYVPSCGWGILETFDADGTGYINFEKGGGQIINGWDHFFEMVEIVETE